MNFRTLPERATLGLIVPVLLLVASCDSPERQALRALAASGVEPTGASLVEAVSRRDAETAAWLLQARVHAGSRDATGRTPLGIAVENGDARCAKLLLDAGAADAAALGAALLAGHERIIELLAAAGPNAAATMPDGTPVVRWCVLGDRRELAARLLAAGLAHGEALHPALDRGFTEIAPALLAAGADPDAPDASGATPLMKAIERRDGPLLAALLAHRADPNLPGATGETAGHFAMRARWFTGMRRLAEAGADWNVPDASGRTMLASALHAADREAIDFLLENGARPAGDWSPLFLHTLLARDVRTAALLLRHGARPAVPSEWLEAAAARGNDSFLKLLLASGHPPGRSLEIACARGDVATAKLLLACGVAPNSARTPTTGSPFAAALAGGHDALAVLLLEHGANPDIHLPGGEPPLHLAVAKGLPRTTRRLLEYGADPNAVFSRPPSGAFIAHIRPGVMRWVLTRDRNATLLMIAADSGNLEVARALLDAGAKTSAWTGTARLWPINFASRRNDIPMMRLLLGQHPHREERHLIISLSEQRARLFDADGNEVLATRVSTGRRGYETPQGEFVVTNKHRHWTSTLYDASMPYFQRLSCSDFGLHAGHVPGYPASHGCIRVPPADAARLFSTMRHGDRVKIVP